MTNPNADALLQQAQAFIKAGRRNDARPLLEKLVNDDDQNEMGWLFLSACVDSLEEQKICLENVLMLNPANLKAQKGLEVVKQKLAAGTAKAPAARPQHPPQAPPAAPPPSAYDFGSPYDSGVVNSSSDVYDDPNAGAWGSSDAAYDAPIASSVDWGKGSAPAYGSGQNVPQPSAKEFDSWVAKLPLGGKAKEPEPPAHPRTQFPMRSTADMPPVDVEATDEQFNIPSPYDHNDDPFRASFDFSDGTGHAAAQQSVSPFNTADFGGEGEVSFDFSGEADFGGPFSANTGSAVNAPSAPDYSYTPDSGSDSSMFKFDTNTFQSQDPNQGYGNSYEQSSTGFKVPGGYSDPSAVDSNSYPAAGRGRGGTSADRFKFGGGGAGSAGGAGLDAGITGSKGSRRGVELPGSSGLFRDNPLDSRSDINATITEFSDDELAGASGIFGMASRNSDSRAKRPDSFPSPEMSAEGYGNLGAGMRNVTSSGAFRLIPQEIKVRGGARRSGGAAGARAGGISIGGLLAVLVLLALNVVSILILIFFNLRGMGIV